MSSKFYRLPSYKANVVAALGVCSLAFAGAQALDAVIPTVKAQDATSVNSEKTAGESTVWASGQTAFSFPLANLPDEERTRFSIGNSFFRRNWVQAPASTTARDGLGPHFLARACAGCHVQDGRGAPPSWQKGAKHEMPQALLMRLSIDGIGENGGVVPDPVYGDQFNNQGIDGVKPEGDVRIRWSTLSGKFADGTPYTLKKPHYTLANLNYGAVSPNVRISPRVAPQLMGVGFLEAIDEKDILENAKNQSAQNIGIKGEPNWVWDAVAKKQMIGRFGWKANVATLAHQTAGAFLGDIGITSEVFPGEACTKTQKDCVSATSGATLPETEIDTKTLNDVIFYQATLAPAARREPQDEQVLKGQALFHAARCATCHRPSYTTAKAPFANLSSKVIENTVITPYTDLLLHDMGENLADHRSDFKANGRQWKTPALWGIGLIADVNKHTRLLHDGRANGVLEAVLWHGGEAEYSRQNVLKMSKREREALVKFVQSL